MNDNETALAGLFLFPQSAANTASIGLIPATVEAAGREEFLIMLKDALSQLGEEKAQPPSEKSEENAAISLQNTVKSLLLAEGIEISEILSSEEKNSSSLPILGINGIEGLKPPIMAESSSTSEILTILNTAGISAAAISAENGERLSNEGSEPKTASTLSIGDRFILPPSVVLTGESENSFKNPCSEEFINHYKEVLGKAKEILGWLKADTEDEPENKSADGNYIEESEGISLDDLLEVPPGGELADGAFKGSAREIKPANAAVAADAKEEGERSTEVRGLKGERAKATEKINYSVQVEKTEVLKPSLTEGAERTAKSGESPLKNLLASEVPKDIRAEELFKSKSLIGAEIIKGEAAKNGGAAIDKEVKTGETAEKAADTGQSTLSEREAAKKDNAKSISTENLKPAPRSNIAATAMPDTDEETTVSAEETSDKTAKKEMEEFNPSQKAADKSSAKELATKTETGGRESETSIKSGSDPDAVSKTDGKLTPKPAAAGKTLEWQSPKDAVKFAKLVQQAGEGGVNKLTVRLVPEHLGRLEIQLTEINGRLDAKILANSMESKNFLAANADAITRQLAEKGITIDNMDFAFHDSFTKDAGEKSGSRRESRANRENVRADNIELKEEGVEREKEGIYA
ncbi:MAG: flagellar hook-length control protein FliK [Deferribacteraceae bacterium]|jgi:flagellar hook-length control protein FliK|nr:flagellar hook-length control protein FliK [Deferribacteraceae bacterium]